VPSCEDCLKNLPHLHGAMKTRLEPLMMALHAATSESKPLTNDPLPEFKPLVNPQPVTGDATAAWAQDALSKLPPKKGDDPAGALGKELETARTDLRTLVRLAEGPLLDRHWFETAAKGSTEPRKDSEPEGSDRREALQPMFTIRADVTELLDSADGLLERTRSENPYLLAGTHAMNELAASIEKTLTAVAARLAELSVMKDDAMRWAKDNSVPVKELKKRVVPELESGTTDEFLADDSTWQVATAIYADVPERVISVVVTVKDGKATPVKPIDEAVAKAKVPTTNAERSTIAAAVATALDRMSWKTTQPGTIPVKFSYGVKKGE
jgi:hypothetical protein